jgi:hypothetical protein
MVKKIAIIWVVLISFYVNAGENLKMSAGQLLLELTPAGNLEKLSDTKSGKNYLVSQTYKNYPSYLIMCKNYGGDLKAPETMQILKKGKNEALLQFNYKSGTKLTVKLVSKDGYFRMELVKAKPLKDIDSIFWGPLKVTMRGPVGKIVGITRDKDFSLGIQSLEPNTDGNHGIAAQYQGYGSSLELVSEDHTRPRKFRKYMMSQPINVTVKGSKAALFGVPAGRKNELAMISKIEINEKLPHPIFFGKWNKETPAVKKISLWIGLDQNNSDKCIQIAKDMGAGTICRMHGYYSNWGHFDVDKNIFPGGRAAVKALNEKAWKEAGVLNTTYTLTGFLKPMSKPEPFITPKPDPRLAKWVPTTSLESDITKDAKEFKVALTTEDMVNIFKENNYKVICVGNEMIEFKEFEKQGKSLLLKKAERGAFKTAAVPHKKGDKVECMLVSGYHNFYPGTVKMNNEMAGYIAKDVNEAGNGVFILDGHESCYETGHGQYALNIFPKIIYETTNSKKDHLITYSITLGNYNWHMMSYVSWGEYDLAKGFRGTCLDYRIMRQIEHQGNLVPNKMGQYYPTKATLEDIEWLMARVCGWDSGVDFNLDINQMTKNKEYKEICTALARWEKARMGNQFSDKEKMFLRQTDRLYHLDEGKDGKLKLKFVKFWHNKDVKIMPSSEFKTASAGAGKVAPCSAKWLLTHNPAIYRECGLSDDLVHNTKDKESKWDVVFPAVTDKKDAKKQHLLPLIRVPENAPCGVKNISIKVGGSELKLPVTLNPGEYLSIPHDTRLGCIYDSKTDDIKREFHVPQFNPYWFLPEVKRGEKNVISVKCESAEKGKNTDLILNLRYWNDIH